MAALFSEAEREFLGRPHVARAWFADVDLPSGRWRLHNGSGNITVGGFEWRGLSDPGGRQLVSIGAVEDPRFGQAAKVDVVLSGVNLDFLRSVKDLGREIEGNRADLYWCAFDQETQEVWSGGLKALFPGYISSIKIAWRGIGERLVPIVIESLWHSQNFPFGGKWSPADQRARYPGDKGLDFVGVRVQEVIRP